MLENQRSNAVGKQATRADEQPAERREGGYGMEMTSTSQGNEGRGS